jgi:hypothetical protein
LWSFTVAQFDTAQFDTSLFASSYPVRRPKPPSFDALVKAAKCKGFVIGREVLLGEQPGLIVGYNIAGFGRFLGAAYPLVVRTEQGVSMVHPDQLALI